MTAELIDVRSWEERPWEEIDRLAQVGDAQALHQFLQALPAGEAARALSRLTGEQQAAALALLAPAEAAELVERLADTQAADVIGELSPANAAAILQQLDSNDQADVLLELDREDAEAIMAAMDPGEATVARTLTAYPPDVAGGLMATEYLAYRADATAQTVVEDLRRNAETYADYQVQYVYVIDRDGRLVGVLRLRDLVLSRPETRLRELMIRDAKAVADTADLDAVEEMFDAYPFVGVPVVDAAQRLVGLIRRSDLMEALAERADSDYRKSQGIVGGEELRSMPVMQRALRRLSWLSVNIVLNVVAASVIAFYQDTLSAVIALAAFLPIISDMSGCSGNQAVAVSMRELALGLVQPAEVLRTWAKEVSVGLFNGVVLGVLLGGVAWLWRGNFYLGLVVGGALAVNTVVAVSIGGTVPLVLRRFGLDPALASGPILTTITDLCGFLLALSFATHLLARLTG